jgi:hypothetical protein
MTSATTLETGLSTAKEIISEHFYSDTWRSTSYLINLLGKIESYTDSLAQDAPDSDYYTAHVALSSAIELISNTYTCPTDDERFAKVKGMYEATIVTFIRDLSDDAFVDLIYLGGLANFVAGMRVHAINRWIEETAPSESKFKALKLAKRDEKAVELAIKTLADVLMND